MRSALVFYILNFIYVFLLGVLFGVVVWLIVGLIWDWEGNVDSCKKGYNDAKEKFNMENPE